MNHESLSNHKAINGITTTWGYTYDTAGRLQRTNLNGSLYAQYGYDTNGNRLTKTTTSQTITGTYDAQDRLLAYGNYVFTYTANGELETKTDTATSETTTYTYDVLGNLKNVVLPDSTLIEYVVDGRNRRVGKKVNGTLERSWIYDGQLRPVAELDGSGVLTAQYVYATHINVPDYVIKGATTYRVITDHLGSLRFVIDTATGTIAQRMDYDDWGNVLVNTAPDFTPFGFAGGMYDSQTKLVRFGARDYDAETGRWTAKDPIAPGIVGFNAYEYVWGKPNSLYDPSGLWGLGLGLSWATEGGAVAAGVAQSGSAGGFHFFGDKGGETEFASWGGMLGGPGYGLQYPKGGYNVITGAYAGLGAMFYFTTADCPDELKGAADTYFIDIGVPFNPFLRGSLQISFSDSGEISLGFSPPGAGFGAGAAIGLLRTMTDSGRI